MSFFGRAFGKIPFEVYPLLVAIGGACTFGVYSLINAGTTKDVYFRKSQNPFYPDTFKTNHAQIQTKQNEAKH